MSLPRNRIIVGDALATMRTLPSTSVDMVLTSPPYLGLRDYKIAGQLGQERHVDSWVEPLRAVAQEAARVLVPTGTLWLNVGDSYSIHTEQGAERKSLLLGPERLVLALTADGWLLRNKIIWQKPNPMPTSVRDRLACTWEYIYVLARNPSYYFDLDAVRRPHRSRPSATRRAVLASSDDHRGPNSMGTSGLLKLKANGLVGHPLGANPGDVLRLASSNYRGGHRATFPLGLADYALRAGCPEARCTGCRRPHVRRVLRALGGTAVRSALGPTCDCTYGREPGIVLDPFMGAGTTALAARALHRDWLGVELSPTFAQEARSRIA
ncbi:DNA modification methylase [Jatrophihabitans endophyticus]|uniref:Methyltransferase n=1 Tax=Jatrophihabitans endophyticus TaxID=1206085 RepID=A0A1M5RYR3_9ACTN|nr:site-specific DNA-methyltransferase [Jatrophihabitans endophyticus]SHH31178.1 DNA modification methylase [Jatrophihabitans endophyticus]